MVEHAAAGLYALGVDADVNVSWQLPTWTESAVLVGALCRLGAVQNPMLPIYRYREVSFIAQQTGCKLLITPSTWNKFDYGALAEQVAGEIDGMHALVADHWNPDGDPATLPPAAPGADSPADDPVRWIFYTSGTTAEPKGARHTDRSVLAGRDRLREEDARRRVRHRARRVPVHARRRHHHRRLHAAAHRIGRGADGGVDAAGLDRADPASTRSRSATARPRSTPRCSPKRTRTPTRTRRSATFPSGGSAKPPQLHDDLMGAVPTSVGITVGLRDDRSADRVADRHRRARQTRSALAEGTATPGVEFKVLENGELVVKGPQVMRGYVDARSTPTRSPTTAGCTPATWRASTSTTR